MAGDVVNIKVISRIKLLSRRIGMKLVNPTET